MADTDPLWKIPEHAWDQLTAGPDMVAVYNGFEVEGFRRTILTLYDWDGDKGWISKRKEENGTSQDE